MNTKNQPVVVGIKGCLYFHISVLLLFTWLWYLSIKYQSIIITLIFSFFFMAILPKLMWQSIWILRESNLKKIFPHDYPIKNLLTNELLTVHLLWHCSISGLVPALISSTKIIENRLIWLQGVLKVAKKPFNEQKDTGNLYLDQGTLILEMNPLSSMALLTIKGVPDYYRNRGKTGFCLVSEPGECQVKLFDCTQAGREIRQRLLLIILGGALLFAVVNTMFSYLIKEKYLKWCYATQEYNLAQSSRSWPTASGKIYSTELRQISLGKNQWAYEIVIGYTYEVAEILYHSDRLHFGYVPSPINLIARKKLEDYPIGRIVQVAYDPQMPERSTLEAGVKKTDELVSQAQRAFWFFLSLFLLISITLISASIVLSKMIYQQLINIISKLSQIF